MCVQEREGRRLDLSQGLVVRSLNSASSKPLNKKTTSTGLEWHTHIHIIQIYINFRATEDEVFAGLTSSPRGTRALLQVCWLPLRTTFPCSAIQTPVSLPWENSNIYLYILSVNLSLVPVNVTDVSEALEMSLFCKIKMWRSFFCLLFCW